MEILCDSRVIWARKKYKLSKLDKKTLAHNLASGLDDFLINNPPSGATTKQAYWIVIKFMSSKVSRIYLAEFKQ